MTTQTFDEWVTENTPQPITVQGHILHYEFSHVITIQQMVVWESDWESWQLESGLEPDEQTIHLIKSQVIKRPPQPVIHLPHPTEFGMVQVGLHDDFEDSEVYMFADEAQRIVSEYQGHVITRIDTARLRHHYAPFKIIKPHGGES